MGLMKNLFETASNIAATAVNIAKILPEGLNNMSRDYERERILDVASRLKQIDEGRGQTAPNWFYIEKAKKGISSNYSIPQNLKSDYQRYSRTYGKIPGFDSDRDNDW